MLIITFSDILSQKIVLSSHLNEKLILKKNYVLSSKYQKLERRLNATKLIQFSFQINLSKVQKFIHVIRIKSKRESKPNTQLFNPDLNEAILLKFLL